MMCLSETDVARGQNFAAKPFNKGVTEVKNMSFVDRHRLICILLFCDFKLLRYFMILLFIFFRNKVNS